MTFFNGTKQWENRSKVKITRKEEHMKRTTLILAAIMITFSLAACGGDIENEETQNPGTEAPESQLPSESEPPVNIDGSLEEILHEIYETATLSESFREFTKNGLITTKINQGGSEYFFGTDDIEFKEAIASEPMMTTSAYSLCLMRLNDEESVDKIKETIKNNVNPQKWICVGVKRENVIVDNMGDLVILIMSDNEADSLHEAFLKLAE